jgi:hypothetical protein
MSNTLTAEKQNDNCTQPTKHRMKRIYTPNQTIIHLFNGLVIIKLTKHLFLRKYNTNIQPM